MTTQAKCKTLSTAYLTRIGILAAVGIALSMIEIVVLPGAPFYKLDPSGLAVMLAGFSMGFPAGVLTLLIEFPVRRLIFGRRLNAPVMKTAPVVFRRA